MRGKGLPGPVLRVVPRFDLLGDVIEKQPSERRRHRKHQKEKGDEKRQARADAQHPIGPGPGKLRHANQYTSTAINSADEQRDGQSRWP